MFWLRHSNHTREHLRRDLDRLFTVQSILKKISKKETFAEIAVETLTLLQKKMNFTGASISLVDFSNDTIQLKYLSRSYLATISRTLGILPDEAFKPLPLSTGPLTLTKKAALENKIYVNHDLSKFISPPLTPQQVSFLAGLTLSKCMIAIPIRTREKVIGVLNFIMHRSPREITTYELKTLEQFTDQLGLIFDNVLKYEQIKAFNHGLRRQVKDATRHYQVQNRDLEALYSLTSSISQTLDPERVAALAVNILPLESIVVVAFLTVLETKANELVVKATTDNVLAQQVTQLLGDLEQYRIRLDDPTFQDNPGVQAYQKGELQVCNDLNKVFSPPVPSKYIPLLKRILRAKSFVILPVKTHSQKIGTLTYILRHKEYDQLDVNQHQILTTYALQIGIALDNALNYRQANKVSQDLAEANDTLQKQLDHIEELRRQERDMVDIMGHELRTPLSIAKINLPRLMKFVTPRKEFRKRVPVYSQRISDAIHREAKLVETLLSATKLENRKLQLEISAVSPANVITNTRIAFHNAAAEKGLQLVTPSEAELAELPLVAADPTRLQEILDNLVSNGIKYTAKGSVTVTAKVENQAVRFMVNDTGMGIPEEAMPHLGKKFYRVGQHLPGVATINGHKMKLVRPGGTGLGLFIVFGLVKAHGGTVSIDSQVGHGSSFSFTIPLASSQLTRKGHNTSKHKKTDSQDMFARYGLKRSK